VLPERKVIHMDSQCPTLPIKIEEKYEKFQDSSWKWGQVQHSSRRNVRIACLTTQKRKADAGLGNPAYTRLRCTSAVVPLWRDKTARQPGRKTHGQSSLWCFLRKSLILSTFIRFYQVLTPKKRCYEQRYGKWQMANGRWQMADGKWQMGTSRGGARRSVLGTFIVNH
jgi:hypothetical protein